MIEPGEIRFSPERERQVKQSIVVTPESGTRRGMPCVCRVASQDAFSPTRLGTRKACLYGTRCKAYLCTWQEGELGHQLSMIIGSDRACLAGHRVNVLIIIQVDAV